MSALISATQASRRYGDAQGNIIKGHGRKHVTLLFLNFAEPAGLRQWLSQVLAAKGPVRLVSAAQQLAERAAFKASGGTADAGLFATLLFTAAGLRHLQVPAAHMPQEAAQQASFGRSGAFEAGMRDPTTQQALRDPAPAEWDPGWLDAAARPTPIHALLLLADARAGRLRKAVAATKAQLPAFGATLQVEENGQRLLAKNQDIEHFGYADGVSQPIYLTDDRRPQSHQLDQALGLEDLVLVPDRLGQGPKAWGSFLVFRKLAQAVPQFKRAEKQLAQTLGLRRADAERAGAMLVGRFEDGSPLTMQGQDGHSPVTNNFDYAQDAQGLKCPFHAHIRKMHPRGETQEPTELRHRITRRGIPYGSRAAATRREPAGLLFMCYQRNIGQQFEFLQRSWANNPGFPAGHGTVGLDPIIGQGPRPALTCPVKWGEAGTATAPFEQFVTLRGGEYFYAPSMSGLARLAAGFAQ